MCAKFCGAWDKNDLNMDLKMSAGPVLCYGGTPKFGPFFQLFSHSQYFWLKVITIIVVFSCIEHFFWAQLWKKYCSNSNIKKDILCSA